MLFGEGLPLGEMLGEPSRDDLPVLGWHPEVCQGVGVGRHHADGGRDVQVLVAVVHCWVRVESFSVRGRPSLLREWQDGGPS